MTKVAINGLGRIGRAFLRMAYNNKHFTVVAINDLGEAENLAYLLQHDSVYGRADVDISVKGDKLIIDGVELKLLQERDPEKLPWGALDVDIVVESTGFFTDYADAKKHLTAGAKRVVLSAPAKGDAAKAGVKGATVLMGVNEDVLHTSEITSNASCTTNATSPVIGILKEAIGIKKAVLNTVHAYTASQSLVDSPNKKDPRGGRAAALNIIPSTTGAAVATTKAHTELEGKFDGLALRVPVPVGSIADITMVTERPTTVKEVNAALVAGSESDNWKHIFTATDAPLVSTDIIGARFGSIADLSFTQVVDGDLVKVLAWYDNETSYTHTLVTHVEAVAKVVAEST